MAAPLIDMVEARFTAAYETPSSPVVALVLYADKILREEDPSYETPDFDPLPFETVADELFEATKSASLLPDVRAQAIYVVARLYALDIPSDLADEATLDALADAIRDRLAAGTKPKRYLDFRFDVSDLSGDEVSCLWGEVAAQAERSEGHPSVEAEGEIVEHEAGED